ncbi:MAG: hypothetical protein KIT09_20005 [Bryobacteraceae bacterium]|nr:hypothetical protein [Bryobacteraceae bacterium]
MEAARLRFELLLVNPQTVPALRGHKTDRIDAARIAEFLQYVVCCEAVSCLRGRSARCAT